MLDDEVRRDGVEDHAPQRMGNRARLPACDFMHCNFVLQRFCMQN
jgi:hypothetical protein